jgi:ABC-2 type transport system ATP-binding protein
MDDVVALCPRVIVIDGGTIIHDGDLRGLVKTMHPGKLVSFTLGGPVSDDAFAHLGEVTKREANRIVMQVADARLKDVVAHLLATLPVTDLSVEDPPLEDVMRALFKDKAAALAPTQPVEALAAPDPGEAQA